MVCFFASGGKLLANVMIKGLRKSGFQGIITWIKYLNENLDKLIHMIMLDPTHAMLKLLTVSLKSGLLSKDTEVAELTCEIFINLTNKLRERNHL